MPAPSSAPLSLPSLTLIVATTPAMGIGRAGSLPWPALKTEMGYFARVTKRTPLTPSSTTTNNTTTTTTTTTTKPLTQSSCSGGKMTNAIIMGRKTWESIPGRFRPLRDRINVVISRRGRESLIDDDEDAAAEVMVASSLEDGVKDLVRLYGYGDGEGRKKKKKKKTTTLGRVFIIGGAEIYRAAMGGGNIQAAGDEKISPVLVVDRILWTRIKSDFECDTFFPVDLERLARGGLGWVRRSKEELERWTGEDGLGGLKKDEGVEYEICLLERC